jgi:hypothetical protein
MLLARTLFGLRHEIPEEEFQLITNFHTSQPEILYATVNEVAKIE